MLNRAVMTGKGRSVVLAALGVVMLVLGGIFAKEMWPESTGTSGDCARDVRCPSFTIESGSAAWAFVGCALGLVGLIVLLTVMRSVTRHHETTG